MEFILIALATAFNILVIKWKVENKRWEDAMFDGIILFVLAAIFAGSFGGLVVATITSLIISIYFIASPPKFTGTFVSEFKKRASRTNA